MKTNDIVSGTSLLVVDDNEDIREVVAIILSKNGYRCELAKNGVEAIQRARQSRFDAVIIDVEMPEMDGIALTRELNQHFLVLPVMIMTGHSHESFRERGSLAGAKEFVNKPFNVPDFVTRLQRMLLTRKWVGEQKT